jgi:hypothetical protein
VRHRPRRPVTGGHATGAWWSKAGERGSGCERGCGAGAGWASFGCWAAAEVRPFFSFYFLKNPKQHKKVTILSNIKAFSRLGPKIKVVYFEEKNISY